MWLKGFSKLYLLKELSEKCENLTEEVKKYKKMLKVYIKRSKTSKFRSQFSWKSNT